MDPSTCTTTLAPATAAVEAAAAVVAGEKGEGTPGDTRITSTAGDSLAIITALTMVLVSNPSVVAVVWPPT